MDKKRFLELIKMYQDDPASLKSLEKDEAIAFQTELENKGFELPKYGHDGDIGGETTGAIDSYLKSDVYTKDITPDDDGTGGDGTGTPTETGDDDYRNAELERKTVEEELRYATNKKAADDFAKEKAFAQKDVYNVAQLGSDAVRLSQALSQIKQAKDQREAPRPEMPMRELSPELEGAYERSLASVGKGFTDAERAARAGLDMSAYANAMAKVGQSGQASTIGTGAQALYAAQLKNNLQSAVADSQARQANEAYAANAGAMLAQDRNTLYNQQLQYGYMPKLQEWRRKQGEASMLERQGRVNLDNLMSVAPYRAANMVGDYYGMKVQRGAETPLERQQRLNAINTANTADVAKRINARQFKIDNKGRYKDGGFFKGGKFYKRRSPVMMEGNIPPGMDYDPNYNPSRNPYEPYNPALDGFEKDPNIYTVTG